MISPQPLIMKSGSGVSKRLSTVCSLRHPKRTRIDVVFRPDMVPAGTKAPSRQDAEERLRLYLAAQAPGDAYEEYRRFLKASLALAQARTHSARTGRAAAVAAAQGLLSFVRALQALERTARVRDTTSNPESMVEQ